MANNPANINQLVQSVLSTGLVYANRYEVAFAYPMGWRGGAVNIDTLRSLSMRCDAVTIPGRSFSTTPFRFYGPARNMPYEQIYSGEMTLSVILSQDMREKQFFEDWMGLVSDLGNYKFQYYDQYVTDTTITVLDKNDAVNYIVTINETYPKMIGDLQVGYDKDNEFLRQDITLCFRKYSLQYVGMPAPTRAAGTIGQPPTVIPGPQQSIQSLIRNGNRIDRVGPDGTVNGIYDPATAQQLIYGRGVQPTGYPPRNG
jgi:hypothetical protein